MIKIKETGNLTCEIKCNTKEELLKIYELAKEYGGELIDFEEKIFGSVDYVIPYELLSEVPEWAFVKIAGTEDIPNG